MVTLHKRPAGPSVPWLTLRWFSHTSEQLLLLLSYRIPVLTHAGRSCPTCTFTKFSLEKWEEGEQGRCSGRALWTVISPGLWFHCVYPPTHCRSRHVIICNLPLHAYFNTLHLIASECDVADECPTKASFLLRIRPPTSDKTWCISKC